MKKIVALLMSILLVIGAMPTITAFATSEEVPEGYIGIYDIEDLYCIRYDLDKNYILMADIDMTEDTAEGGLYDSGYGWKPICDGETSFSGTFDGNGHAIKGMQTSGCYGDYVGLFGISSGDFKNLKIIDFIITNPESKASGKYIGCLVGYGVGCTFSDIYITGRIEQTSLRYDSSIGGLIGYEKCDNINNRYGLFKNIISEVSINCSSTNVQNSNFGGIIGTFWGSYNNDNYISSVECMKYKGSISIEVGCTNNYSSFIFCVGGIIGLSSYVSINKCSNEANIKAIYNVSGYMNSSASFTSTHKLFASGIAGYSNNGIVINCKNNGSVSGSVIADRCFYESGYKYHYLSGFSYVSGIVNQIEADKGIIENCYNTESVFSTVDHAFNSYIYAAGISTNGDITNCYNLGKISANGTVDPRYPNSNYGGKSKETNILSSGISSLGDVTSSVNLGKVSPNKTAISTGTIENCYYLFGTAEKGNENQIDTNSTAVSLTEQQFKNKSFLTNLDFENTWFFDLESGIEHPQLISNPEIEHVHKFVSVVTQPKCTEKGYTTYTCSCGESYVSDYVDETGHNFGIWTIKEEPTCQKEGILIRYCSKCEGFEEVPVNKVEHKYIDIVTEPTCTKAGYTTHRCVYCGDEYTDTPVKAKEHKMVIKTITPTCTQNGCDIHICTECGYNYFDNETLKLNHSPILVNAKEATQGKDGYTGDVVCERCEEMLKKGEVIHSHAVRSVSIDDISMNYKNTTTITPKIEADDGVTYTVEYTTSNPKVATVDNDGKVYAAKRGSGSATITCTVTDQHGNVVTDECKVNVSLTFVQKLIVYVLFGWIWY